MRTATPIFFEDSVAALWVTFLSFALWLANIGDIKPITGAQQINSGSICVDESCSEQIETMLPLQTKHRYDVGIEVIQLRFILDLPERPDQLQALYLPKISDDVFVSVNGATVFGEAFQSDQKISRLWNQPILIPLAPTLLRAGENILDVTLMGHPQEGLELHSFFIGAQDILSWHYDLRYLATAGVAQFSLGMSIIFCVMFGVLWLVRNREPIYLSLMIASVCASISCLHFSFDTGFVPYFWWTVGWQIIVTLYVYSVMIFTKLYFENAQLDGAIKIYRVFLVLEIVTVFILPEKYAFLIGTLFKLNAMFGVISMVCAVFYERKTTNSVDFGVLFLLYSIASSVGLLELYFIFIDQPDRSMRIFQYAPLDMLGVSLWMVISQLTRSLKKSEKLTKTMQSTIDETTLELKTTYERLRNAEQQKAINTERQRIMTDLHDGIGGQLVNTIAYMQNNRIGDKVMLDALEYTLRDLSLMVDSMDADENISTLLGMLRARFETLLAAHNLKFIWKIEEDPVLPTASSSHNLHLMRIVQESVTNVVKHAKASSITISSSANAIIIQDDGRGFDIDSVNETKRGHGLVGMKRRAQAINASFDLESHDTGATIKLTWIHDQKSHACE